MYIHTHTVYMCIELFTCYVCLLTTPVSGVGRCQKLLEAKYFLILLHHIGFICHFKQL